MRIELYKAAFLSGALIAVSCAQTKPKEMLQSDVCTIAANGVADGAVVRLSAIYETDMTHGTVIKNEKCMRSWLEESTPPTALTDSSVSIFRKALVGDGGRYLRKYSIDVTAIVESGQSGEPPSLQIIHVWKFEPIK